MIHSHTSKLAAVGIFVFLNVAFPATAAEYPAQADVARGWASDRLVVRFQGKVIEQAAALSGSKRAIAPTSLVASLSPGLQTAYASWNAVGAKPLYPREFGDPELAARLGLDRIYLIEVPPGTDVPAMAAEFREYADQVELAGLDVVGSASRVSPDDSLFGQQYALDNDGVPTGWTFDADIDAPEAWDIHTGDLGTVTIAIIDSGVDMHVEFAGRMVPGINVTPIGDPTLTTDGNGHGTHVAGIAAAEGNNGMGIAGVTWGANIMPVRVLAPSGFGTVAVTAEGLIWAADNGADVCNLSLEFYGLDCDMEAVFQSAVDYAHQRGAIVIAASGNGRGREIAYPAVLDNCLAVGYTDQADQVGSLSNYGNELDVTAPGNEIISTDGGPNAIGDYRERTGTSMAAPLVSGLAALIESYSPALTNEAVREIITSTVDDLGPAGWDERFGYGRINAFAALVLAGNPAWLVSSTPPDGAIDAGRPCEPGGANTARCSVVELAFTGGTSGMTRFDFALDPPGTSPSILDVVPAGNRITLNLDGPIPTGAWTTITHLPSGRSVRLGALPGDVNGDGTASVMDVIYLIDAYKVLRDPSLTCIQPLPSWSTDIDRSGTLDLTDVLVLIDLLNGAGSFDVYMSASLP